MYRCDALVDPTGGWTSTRANVPIEQKDLTYVRLEAVGGVSMCLGCRSVYERLRVPDNVRKRPPSLSMSNVGEEPVSVPSRTLSQRVASGRTPLGWSRATYSRPWKNRPFAVIDLGSNSARLVIYRSAPLGPAWSVHECKEYPRLVEDIGPDGGLSKAAIRRGLATLQRFRRILDTNGVIDIRAVATSAVREAPNGAAFVADVRRRYRIPLQVLSAEAEGQYAYLGVASAIFLHNDLIVDLGGGSLQAIQTRNSELSRSLSLPLGALRLHRRYLDHDPPKPRELRALEDHVDEKLRAIDRFKLSSDERIIGVGGTIRSLAHAMQAIRGYPLARVHGYELRTRDLERLYDILSESAISVRREVPGVSADRSDIIVAGLATVLGILHRRRGNSLLVSGCGIREGLAQDILGRPLPASVEEMAQSSALASLWASGSDGAHARRVWGLSLALFDLTRSLHRLGSEERLVLEVAALMHDIGATLSYPSHAAHSAYILRSRPLYGLSHRGFLLSSLIVSMHEGNDVPSDTVRRYPLVLEEEDLKVARTLGTLLALAESLGDVQPRPRLRRKGKRVFVSFSPNSAFDPRLFERSCRWMRKHLEVKVRVES